MIMNGSTIKQEEKKEEKKTKKTIISLCMELVTRSAKVLAERREDAGGGGERDLSVNPLQMTHAISHMAPLFEVAHRKQTGSPPPPTPSSARKVTPWGSVSHPMGR